MGFVDTNHFLLNTLPSFAHFLPPQAPVLGRVQSPRNGARPKTGAGKNHHPCRPRKTCRRAGNRVCKHSAVLATSTPLLFWTGLPVPLMRRAEAPAPADPRRRERSGSTGRAGQACAGITLGGSRRAAEGPPRVFRSQDSLKGLEGSQRPGNRALNGEAEVGCPETHPGRSGVLPEF